VDPTDVGSTGTEGDEPGIKQERERLWGKEDGTVSGDKPKKEEGNRFMWERRRQKERM
jgi:hypothetical protein